MQVLNYRWLLRGHRFFVGVGGGRKRLNILGGWCPENHEYLDLRMPKDNVNAQTFIDLMNLMHQRHPQIKKFILYLDNAKYFHAKMVREWVEEMKQQGVTFVLAQVRQFGKRGCCAAGTYVSEKWSVYPYTSGHDSKTLGSARLRRA